jgi:hypothetical protein
VRRWRGWKSCSLPSRTSAHSRTSSTGGDKCTSRRSSSRPSRKPRCLPNARLSSSSSSCGQERGARRARAHIGIVDEDNKPCLDWTELTTTLEWIRQHPEFRYKIAIIIKAKMATQNFHVIWSSAAYKKSEEDLL